MSWRDDFRHGDRKCVCRLFCRTMATRMLKATAHPKATTDPDYRGQFVFAAQNLPITSAGNEDDPRAKVFTRDCLIACRKFLEHLVSEDEEFRARFGPTSIPPVISNDNIVLLESFYDRVG